MIPASFYHPIYLYLILALTIIFCVRTSRFDYQEIKKRNKNIISACVLCLILALFIGGRPISGYYFGDTSNYALIFNAMKMGRFVPTDEREWVWQQFMYWCSQRMDVSQYFTIIDLCYFGFTLWACKRLTPNNVLASVLFCLGAFSFFSYGTNGIRNGVACSLILLFLSYLTGNKKDKLIGAGIAFVAFNIHHSTGLPILMSVISLLCIRSFKWAYTFWIISILISLAAGGAVTSFFASLGFDDRVSYLQAEMNSSTFSHTGFRWDFLIYSMMPIVLGYYIIHKRGIRNATYEFLLNTYTLSNAFWVMVIRANYSNRFAYLSWFLYPVVLAYPLLKINVWGEIQGKRLSQIMLAHVGFTWFMSTLF